MNEKYGKQIYNYSVITFATEDLYLQKMNIRASVVCMKIVIWKMTAKFLWKWIHSREGVSGILCVNIVKESHGLCLNISAVGSSQSIQFFCRQY
jgi:hypothetical protein